VHLTESPNLVSHSLKNKNPRLFQDHPERHRNFTGPVWSPQMFKCNEKTAFTYDIQSLVNCRKFSMKQNVDVSWFRIRM